MSLPVSTWTRDSPPSAHAGSSHTNTCRPPPLPRFRYATIGLPSARASDGPKPATRPTGLVMVQPDLGTSLLVVAAGGFALFFAGLRWRWILGAIAAVAATAPFLWMRLHDYQRGRILTLFNPERDPLGAGYHITQ